MGTTQSRGESEWKGPFSDEEYDRLVVVYQEITSGKSNAATQQALQERLTLPLHDDLPSEWREGLGRLGASFFELCLHSRELAGSSDTSTQLKLNDFVQGVAQCIRASSQAIYRSLFHLFVVDKKSAYLNEDEVHQLLLACLLMTNAQIADEEPRELVRMIKKLAESALPTTTGDSTRQLSMDEFLRWSSAQLPLMFSAFTTWISKCFLDSLARAAYNPPVLTHKSDILSKTQFGALSLIYTPLQKRMDRLYTNAKDGLSFNRLCYHILGYGGPTLIVIRDTDGDVFGMYCDTEWRETTKFYGGNGCFLFRVEPYINVYRVSASDANENYMYLNTKGFALPKGIGMGGTLNGFRLFLNEDFDDNCYSAAKCLSFEPGRLTKKDQFAMDAIEVWGCGGDESLQRQGQVRKDTAEMLDKMRKVDKAAFVGNDFDRSMFLGKTFGHGTDQARIADDEH
ncbi:hypothetical protein Poli38472_002331 [Pythium oligandrum]|uniref:TLDc domain-containing protein n=1 Tax=Pythium oligandrum TaxID=41045 RepID=A0A8K1FH13_PYTOL|nr:hypothetical protein Poli38472_002331 [Pythium oligandrum]|eukprot:TMW63390.1 hypothetical protein Poli38472_002331 [Pythium oligandrum]